MSKLRAGLVALSSLLLPFGCPLWRDSSGAEIRDTVLARGTSPDGIVVSGRGTTEVTMHEITIAPGGSTGWHYHDGQLIAVVKSGVLTHTRQDCSTEVTSAGAAFVEQAGPNHAHNGRNLGAEPVVLLVTFVLPAGQPPSQESLEPRCDRR